MSEPVRLEHQERVRDFYRNQGAVKERERIIDFLNMPKHHSIEMESITLRAGEEAKWIRKHSPDCVPCIAIALIKGEANV